MLDKSLTFGLRLQIIRKTQDITQKKLAELTGIYPQQISLYETDQQTPTLTNLKLLCEALGVTATELLGY